MGLDRFARAGGLACLLLAMRASLAAQAPLPVPSAELGTIRCSVTSPAPMVRSEGTRELLGDVVLTCHNVGPSVRFDPKGFVVADISLTLSVDFANRVDWGQGQSVSDAVLTINGKNCAAASQTSTFARCGTGDLTVQDPMLGRLAGGQSRTMRWQGVSVPIPGAAIGGQGGGAEPLANCAGRIGMRGGCHPPTTTVRLTNLRANVSQVGVAGGASAAAVPVSAELAVHTADSSVRLEDSVVHVAQAAPGLGASMAPFDGNRLCSHGEATAEITVEEGFAAAFKTRGRPSFQPGDPGWDEAFFPLSGIGSDPALMVRGTRLALGFSGVPAGVTVAAPAAISCSAASGAETLSLGLVRGAAANGEGGSLAAAQPGFVALPAGGGADPVAVYEVTAAQPLAREECRIPVQLTRDESTPVPELGSTVTVSAALAPAGASLGRGEASRFVPAQRAAGSALRLSPCGTTLFFPFVTTRANFDTAIVIANTSADPLGTRHQAGSCSLRYHGSAGEGRVDPSAQTTVELAAGKQLAFTLSSGNASLGIAAVADFQGYLLAECDFQHAQGFAFVTEQLNGAAILAQGYLAEILTDPLEGAPDTAPR